jgi:RNA polymerase sigma-70 factor (ECF subfamily)
MESKEKVEEIMRMIFQLPEKQRDAIVLTKIQGESLTEASNLMGVSAKSLENYLLRAKVALRSKLQKNSDTKI